MGAVTLMEHLKSSYSELSLASALAMAACQKHTVLKGKSS